MNTKPSNVRELKGPHFGKLYEFAMNRPLSLGARALYAQLVHYGSRHGYCWPSMAELAAKLGVTDRAVRKYRAELEREGLITVTFLGRSNRYDIIDDEVRAMILRGRAEPEFRAGRNLSSGQGGTLVPGSPEPEFRRNQIRTRDAKASVEPECSTHVLNQTEGCDCARWLGKFGAHLDSCPFGGAEIR